MKCNKCKKNVEDDDHKCSECKKNSVDAEHVCAGCELDEKKCKCKSETTDNRVWLGFFITVAIITFGFVITSFTAADQSIQEFSKDVAVILIPIVAGGIVTKFTTDSK